jgi:site-specific DNA-methyltransferase (adenine-specific)
MKLLIHGDCLEKHTEIEDESVNLILTDLPYGTIKGAGFINSNTDWDIIIDPKQIFTIAERILKINGKMILFAQEPFSTLLINSQTANLPFLYKCIWKKSSCGNTLLCNKAPVNYFEEILVFAKKYALKENQQIRDYFKSVFEFIGLSKKEINNRFGNQKADHCFRFNSTQFTLCRNEVYTELIRLFEINLMPNFIDYETLKTMNQCNKSVFNLWESNKLKSNIFEYVKDKKHYHPTQKPVALLEDLIKTYSNEGDLIVDLTMGSGSTGVACINTNRSFIGIEKEKSYYDIAVNRIKNI